jgi:intraflagellar transport protein 122
MTGEEYRPVAIDEQTLISLKLEDVYILDLTKYCPTLPRKYYKNMIPDVEIIGCEKCGHFFLGDQYEFSYLEFHACPFCRCQEGQEEVPSGETNH